MQKMDNFDQTIVQIGNEVKSLSVPDELFTSKAFIAIYEDPQTYFTSACALIARRNVSMHQKRIVGYAMQRLPVENFVVLVSSMANSVEEGATNIEALISTTFTPLNWGKQPLIMHYQHPQVQAFLERLIKMTNLPKPRKDYIRDKMLNGQARNDYLDYLSIIGRQHKE